MFYVMVLLLMTTLSNSTIQNRSMKEGRKHGKEWSDSRMSNISGTNNKTWVPNLE